MNENQKKHIATATIAMTSIIFSATIAGIISNDSSTPLIATGIFLSVSLYSIGIIILRRQKND